jgi:hypothetical protein
MCSGLMRLTLCVGLLTMTSACDQYHPPTGPSPFRPEVNPTPTPPPTPRPLPPPTPSQIPTTIISVGAVIHASIGPGDPICDPSGWDARAPCKLFLLTPARDGTLNVTLTATSPSPLSSDVVDLMLFAQPFYPGAPFQYSTGSVSAPVVEGRTYLIRINSYPYLLPPPGKLDFELKTEMSAS